MPAASIAKSSPKSLFEPPTNVEKTSAEPAGLSLVANRSKRSSNAPPLCVVSNAPGVVGKPAERVEPPTNALPAASTATSSGSSLSSPPSRVEYTSAEPVALSLVTNASNPPLAVRSNAPAVVGKLPDTVWPVTYALRAPSIAMPRLSSRSVPPRNVE